MAELILNMEDAESMQLCVRCSSALTNHKSGDNRNVLYCAACAMQGRGPPLVSGNRNPCGIESIDSMESTQLYNRCNVSPVAEIDDQAGTSCSNDTLQKVLRSSRELTCEYDHGSNLNVDSRSNCYSSGVSHSQEADDASRSQLLEAQFVRSTCHSQQSSVTRLRKQMVMIAQDKDIPVYCNVASEEEDAPCSQFDDSDDSLIKSTQHSSVFVAVPKNQQQQQQSTSSEIIISGHRMTFNAAKGSVFMMVALIAGCIYLIF